MDEEDKNKSFYGAMMVESPGKAITMKDVEELSESLLARGGRPDTFVVDPSTWDILKKVTFNDIPLRFPVGSWVFDGDYLLEVEGYGQNTVRASYLLGFNKNRIVAKDPAMLTKVPVGSTLESVKVLFGRKTK